ncbi:hypothetical protein Pan54_17780 [Rubinisphaera italica]|uniref:Uncharacterized protein n=2 Tax=Rubinisphaera italica TaxID=2527969 RepID=A0A5C5XE26_9PLAN|nr:hypothetical protein Pan54_17780 [Rubinisphaera italica]
MIMNSSTVIIFTDAVKNKKRTLQINQSFHSQAFLKLRLMNRKIFKILIHSKQWSLLLLFAGLLPLFSGCQQGKAMLGRIGLKSEDAVYSYSDIQLDYETNCKTSLIRRSFPFLTHRVEQTSLEKTEEYQSNAQTVSFADGKWSKAKIQILYPHPDGSLDKGLARLAVTRFCPTLQDSGLEHTTTRERLTNFISLASCEEDAEPVVQSNHNSRSAEEIWELDIPKEELDILIAELKHRGFFENQERPRGEATMHVVLDNTQVTKRWTNEPRLENLMLQVYNEGTLSAFGRKTEPIVWKAAVFRSSSNGS